MSEAQKRTLLTLLSRGGRRRWTTTRVTELIERTFGVEYHSAHVWRLLTGLGWSFRKPARRAKR